jgi:signal transduction histidine kinase
MIAISVVSGKQSGERFECDEEVISVGRGRSNLIVVDDEHVSFQHGQIALQEGEYVYRDLNSRNGSILVRETRRWKLDRVVPEMKLRQGDRIILGFTELEVAVEAPATVRPPATKIIRTQRTDLATTDAADAEGVYNALRKDRETLLTIYELERQIHLAPELSGMEQRVLKAVLNVFPEASSVSIGTVQPGSLNITEFASLAAAGQEEEPISQYMARRALQELKAVCAEEVRTERAGTGPVVASSERCVMCAPLWTGSALRGVIQAFGTARPGCFSGRDLDLFTLFANRAATALTNAELNEQRQRTAHFQELTEYLAHELRCAATGLAEWLRPLEDGQFGELRDLQFEAVHTARLGAQMVGTLVTSMTDLAQLRDPGLLLDVAPVGLDKAAELPVRLAGQIAVSRGLATPVHRPRSGLPPVMANLELLQRAILNLLLFAMAWAEPSAPLILASRLGRDEGTQVLSVHWSGEQIPREERERIFDPETQARLWKDLGHRSAGIGLTFCQLAVARMGGRIRLEASDATSSLEVSLLSGRMAS